MMIILVSGWGSGVSAAGVDVIFSSHHPFPDIPLPVGGATVTTCESMLSLFVTYTIRILFLCVSSPSGAVSFGVGTIKGYTKLCWGMAYTSVAFVEGNGWATLGESVGARNRRGYWTACQASRSFVTP